MGLTLLRVLHRARALAVRLVLAATGSGAMVGLASLGMRMTTAGLALSLMVEPLSLLFVPGVVVALGWMSIVGHLRHHVRNISDNHEFSATLVVWCTFLFYFLLLFWLLSRRRRTAALTTDAGSR